MELIIFILVGVIIMLILRALERRLRKEHHIKRGKGISLIVPFRADGPERQEIWNWLKKYWKKELPEAQLCVGSDDGIPFSKTAAMNAGARKAKGDIFVLLDADAYLNGHTIVHCAEEIREARKEGRHLWFVPYRRFFRLSKAATLRLILSSPKHPIRFPEDPCSIDVDAKSPYGHHHGHWYGALIQIMPREAYELAGGMDERFRSWGAEDISFLRCLDTIYGKHKTTNTAVFALWHPIHGKGIDRVWPGGKPHHNRHLGTRYNEAYGDPERMLKLAQEWQED